MPNPTVSKGYASSFRGAKAPAAYYEVLQSDFGQVGGAAPALAYNAGAGSLAMSTARASVTWITAQGESLESTEATVAISAGTGAFTVTQPTVPTNGATVIGWRIYSSSGGAGSGKLNQSSDYDATTQGLLITASTTQGALAQVIPVATTSAQVKVYGSLGNIPTIDQSGIQTALPSVGANSAADYFIRVPNAGGAFDTQKAVSFARPQGIAEAAGITLSTCDLVNPLYPGANQSVAAGVYMVMANTLYICSTAGTTANPFVGGAAFNQTKGQTTTDGTVVWTSLGKSSLIKMRFSNASGSAAIPVAQEYDFFQH